MLLYASDIHFSSSLKKTKKKNHGFLHSHFVDLGHKPSAYWRCCLADEPFNYHHASINPIQLNIQLNCFTTTT